MVRLTDQQRRIKAMRADARANGLTRAEATKHIAFTLGITVNAVYVRERYVARNGRPGRKPRKAMVV